MAENEPNVNYKKIEFYVLESDLGKITYLDFVISKYLKNGKDIPYQIMDEYCLFSSKCTTHSHESVPPQNCLKVEKKQ